MTKNDCTAGPGAPRLSRLRLWAGTVAVLAAMTAPAAAQLGLPAATQNAHSTLVQGIDAAYHPDHDIFLVVGGQGSIQGVFVNANGAAVTAPFTINTGYGSVPRVAFSRQANGGQGGFLVAWASEEGPSVVVRGRMVAYPGGPLGGESLLSGPYKSSGTYGALDLAYSATSQRFLVAWRDYFVYAAAVDNNANPIGVPVAISTTFGREPGVVWNPTNDEFGVSFSVEGESTVASAFARVPASNLAGFSRTTFNVQPKPAVMTTATDIAFNPNTGRYIMGWFQLGGEGGVSSRIAEIAADGTVVSSGIASYRIGTVDGFSLAFSPVSQTALVAGVEIATDTVLGAELNGNGYRFGPEQTLNGANWPANATRVAESTSSARWLVTFSGGTPPNRRFQFFATQAVTTGTTNGGPAGSYSGGGGSPGGGGSCPGSAPFPGAVCVNGNWIPGDTTTPTPTTGGCPGTAPFPGAVCVNGNWIPGDTTTPTTGGCPGTAPFPGAVCVNGNWIPGDTTTPTTGGCPGTAPFPGAVCVNGNWIPGDTTTGGCPGTAPFPGAVCVNGNWIPGDTTTPTTGGCPGTAPFPGAVCVGGNWIPGTTGSGGTTGGCTTTNPGPAFTCVNGSWTYTGGSGGGSTGGCPGTAPFAGAICVNGNWIPGPGGDSGGGPTASKNGDFNRDGKSDVLFQSASGLLRYWSFGTGLQLLSQSSLAQSSPNSTIQVVSTADLTGDGHPDVLWQDSTTGLAFLHIMNGASPITQQPVQTTATPFRIVGTGDFNLDGHTDLAWLNAATGRVYVWFLRPVAGPAGFPILGFAGAGNSFLAGYIESNGSAASLGHPTWRIGGLGDFNGDGRVDVAWQNSAGLVWLWYLNGLRVQTSTGLTTVADLGWRLAAVGDFAGSSNLEVVWQYTDGSLAIYTLNGTPGAYTLDLAGVTTGGLLAPGTLVGPK
jgi:hypothetical protein